MAYFLSRLLPFDPWRVTTEQPINGEWVELRDVHWYSQAQAEADRRNGKQDGEQGVLPL